MTSISKTLANPSPADGSLDANGHSFPVRIYYEDTDFTGVVYHARYLHFFERGRTEWLRALGISHTDLGDGLFGEPLAFAINRIEVDYKRPAKVDDVVVVRTSLAQARGARLFLRQEMTRPVDGATIALGDVQVVLINNEGSPRRVPADMLMRIEGNHS
ncbi:MAG: YbgC/FadM family acyl-CoA thioesterase [Pseudomonadota bacterium]